MCLTIAIYYGDLSKNLIEYKYIVLKISILDVWQGIEYTFAGLSNNILCAGNKSSVQQGFFTNSMGDLLPILDFLGGLYNFCKLVMISLM